MKNKINKNISVAITTFNGERFVEIQLQSILDQSRRADEVIIIDDCSTDKTPEIVRKFIGDRDLKNWVFKINDKNLGYIRNFNNAIGQTTGDIIFLCDQDDVWHADKIEKILEIFENNPAMQILNTGFRKIDHNGKVINSKIRHNRSNNGLITRSFLPNSLNKIEFEYIIWRNISPGCTAAFTKECKEFYLKNSTFLCPHDWELNVFGAALDGLYFYNQVLTDYRIHSNNTIGIKELKLSDRITAMNNDSRIKTAETEHKRACAYSESSWYNSLNVRQKKSLLRYKYIVQNRFFLISRRRFVTWLKLILCISGYIKLRGPQGIFNDLIFVIAKKRGKKSLYNQV